MHTYWLRIVIARRIHNERRFVQAIRHSSKYFCHRNISANRQSNFAGHQKILLKAKIFSIKYFCQPPKYFCHHLLSKNQNIFLDYFFIYFKFKFFRLFFIILLDHIKDFCQKTYIFFRVSISPKTKYYKY